jgi:AcrR family transcriptional regulator
MVRDANATRQRLLDAAADEFAAFGIAGARVERISVKSRTNKAQIYHYFGSKDGLFNAVLDWFVERNVKVPLDTGDLVGFATRIFDSYENDPRLPRLLTWYRLERGGNSDPLEIVLVNTRDKISAIARAQRLGEVPSQFSARDLLAVILAVSAMWCNLPPEFPVPGGSRGVGQRRAVVAEVVRLLTAQ